MKFNLNEHFFCHFKALHDNNHLIFKDVRRVSLKMERPSDIFLIYDEKHLFEGKRTESTFIYLYLNNLEFSFDEHYGKCNFPMSLSIPALVGRLVGLFVIIFWSTYYPKILECFKS